MTTRLVITINADGTAAIATINSLGKAVKSTGASTEQMGAKSRKAAAETQGLGTKSGGAQAKVVALSAAQTQNAATAQAMGTANRVAAGNMGNLVAQFNDVGVMMAAGQNPLTLALQQGTQISQVIGPMGAAGAVKALGGAFMGMLNPVSLMTIGVIGGGAALVQWSASALGADEKARTFDETLDELTASVGEYRSIADLAASSTADLDKRFGNASGSAKEIGGFLADWARIDAVEKLNSSVAALSSSLGNLQADAANLRGLTDAQLKPFADNFGVTVEVLRTFSSESMSVMADLSSEYGITNDQAATLMLSLRGFGQASGVSAQVDAAVELNEQFKSVFGNAEAIPPSLREVARQAGLIALQAGEITGAIKDTNAALASQYALYGDIRGESDAQLGSAQALLDKMNAQNELQAAIKVFGEGSVEVANLRARAERDVLEEKLSTLDVSEAMKNELRLALSISQQIGTTDLGAGISSATDEAAGLAERLGISLEIATRMAALGPQDVYRDTNGSIYSGRGGDPRELGGSNVDRFVSPEADAFLADWKPKSATQKPKRSSTAREAERERDAVMGLIAGYEVNQTGFTGDD